MGLFDFLKPKPAPQPEDDGPSPDYVFAHYALRQIALSDPLQFLAIVAAADAHRFIDAILQDVAQHCGHKATFDAAAVRIHLARVNGCPCAVIEIPEPKHIAEAFMVALVVSIDASTERSPNLESSRARYFTLEKGVSLSGEPRTVLGEWDARAHSNYGDGPRPTVESFVSALAGHVKASGT